MIIRHSGTHVPGRMFVARTLLLALAIVVTGTTPRAQSFPSGSDGSDGALTVAASQGTIIFDPRDTARWGKVLDPDGDGVYNFTTITIGSGSTVRLQGDKVNTPMYWLASGDVVINGTFDLSGESLTGCCTTDLNVRRRVAIPGSGGYGGGAGGNNSSVPATPGEGPGGGSGGFSNGTQCNYDDNVITVTLCGKSGTFTGNRYLIPLVGGSGGEGARASVYINGGAGGGAILIASSTVITVGGAIRANGSNSGWANTSGGVLVSGGGSGGAIRLVAPTLSGSGHLSVTGGKGSGPGWVRLEGFTISNSLILDTGAVFSTRGSPVDPATLRPTGSIRVTAIDGVPAPANPSGSFVLPDVSISKTGPVNIDIQATGIPPGTVVTLQIYPQSPADLTTVNLPTAQAILAGTVQSSTAMATFTFPYGFSRGFVRATWTQ